jgi:signal transduction histidine kinase/ligand-binding sensor domain-containing protein/CheY-like chemotaxis protein
LTPKAATILPLVLLLACSAVAQPETYYFKNYQVGDGISSNTITCIAQDHKGFMWFGTRNGLNRFDGYAFKTFTHDLLDSSSLGSNSVLSILEDSRGILWVGTHNGIYCFDPQREIFTPMHAIPAGETSAIIEDRQQNIWIVSDFTLYRYSEGRKAVTMYNQAPGQGVVALALSERGALWAATNNGHLWQYNARSDHFTDFSFTDYYNRLPGPKSPTPVQIWDLLPIDDTTVIIGTNSGAWVFNLRNHSLHNLLAPNPWAKTLEIHKIIRRSADEWYFATESGLYIYNTKLHKTTIVQKEYDNPYSITDNVLFSCYQDQEGGVWLGTFSGGVDYYSSQYNHFRKYFRHEGVDGLSGNLVHEICQDRRGNLWVGTEDAGLNKITARGDAIRHFLPGGKGSIAFNNIHGLVASGNELWIGTCEHGLDVMDLRTEKVVRHYDAGPGPGSFKSNFIVTLYRTRKGHILVGTWNGLFEYDRTKDNFRAIPFFNKQIQAIHEDSSGTLWIASYGNGVSFYDPVTRRGGHILHNTTDTHSLVSNYVNNLLEDSRHRFWFCTEDGLSRLDPSSGRITNYTVADGLPTNQLFRMLEDDAHNLWISSAKGLACLDPATGSIKTYTTSSGLVIDQFNYNSAYKRPDGTLFFGSIKGLVSFSPPAFARNRFVPPVYITGMQIDNKTIPVGTPRSPLPLSITYVQQVELSYDHSNISLDIAALSYAAPEMNKYAYIMDGLDKDWTFVSSNRRIYYTKIPQGHYTFRLRGSNNEGLWNPKDVILRIEVRPPWWNTLWAWTCYILVFLAVLFTILRYYYLAVHEKNKRRFDTLEIEKEREIYNAKIEFFTNVAHEIRTPLTLIKMPLDKLIKQPTDNPSLIKERLHMIEKNTNRLIDLTNQLLDFRKAEAGKITLNFIETNIAELLRELFSSFQPAAEQKNLNYLLDLPRMGLYAFVDPEAFRKILSNLLSNAVKYAKSHVTVRLLPFSSEDTIFHIEVRNDGFIIPFDQGEKIFQPFYRLKETENEQGTGIGLPLSRSLAELHNGRLDLKQGDPSYNVFLLYLPIHQEREISFLHPKSPVEDPAASAISEIGGAAPRIHNVTEGNGRDSSRPLILLVEDNTEILHYLSGELSGLYNVLNASNGQEALDILFKDNVQLVVSDIMMPVMDGIALCRKIKMDLVYSHLPVILLTAKSSVASKVEGLEVGADVYIEKPFHVEHLQAQITSLLANRNRIKEHFARSPLSDIKAIGSSEADKTFLGELNDIIYAHITDDSLDVDRLSKLMNMSRTSLYRKISALSNMTPNELIGLTRLKKAAELLANGQYKINEVSALIGYSIPGNFTRDFHRQFGITPSQYLRDIQRGNLDCHDLKGIT